MKQQQHPYGNLKIRTFRCYVPIWKKVEGFVRYNNDRWDNEGHFVRSAVVNFINHLEKDGVVCQGKGRPKKKKEGES